MCPIVQRQSALWRIQWAAAGSFSCCSEEGRQMQKLFSFPLAGGIVLNPSFYGIPGHTHTMIHEIGHSLGLYHVFRGISEILSCSDPCMETEPSFETGDLCRDTNPAPKHKLCGDPGPGNDTCGFHSFLNTPFSNFMSYAGSWASLICCWDLWLGGSREQQYYLWFLQCVSRGALCWHASCLGSDLTGLGPVLMGAEFDGLKNSFHISCFSQFSQTVHSSTWWLGRSSHGGGKKWVEH